MWKKNEQGNILRNGLAMLAGVVFLTSGLSAATESEDGKTPEKRDRMELLRFDKGETVAYSASGDTSLIFRSTLSREKAENGKMYAGKTVLKEGGKYLPLISRSGDLLKGKRGDWTGFTALVIKCFLAGVDTYSATLVFADEDSYRDNLERWNYSSQCNDAVGENWVKGNSGSHCDKQIILLPGENIIRIILTDLADNNGRKMDLAKMSSLAFYNEIPREKDFVIYFQAVYLEKDEVSIKIEP